MLEGVWERLLLVDDRGALLVDVEEEGGFSDLTYSFPSTLLLRRSLYSSPTSLA